MYSNYSIILDKGESHEYFVCHIFRAILSGPNLTFNHFIEISKDYWDIGTDVSSGERIYNASDNYNNILATKQWTKTESNNAKSIALTTRLYKLEQEKNSFLATIEGGGGNNVKISYI